MTLPARQRLHTQAGSTSALIHPDRFADPFGVVRQPRSGKIEIENDLFAGVDLVGAAVRMGGGIPLR